MVHACMHAPQPLPGAVSSRFPRRRRRRGAGGLHRSSRGRTSEPLGDGPSESSPAWGQRCGAALLSCAQARSGRSARHVARRLRHLLLRTNRTILTLILEVVFMYVVGLLGPLCGSGAVASAPSDSSYSLHLHHVTQLHLSSSLMPGARLGHLPAWPRPATTLHALPPSPPLLPATISTAGIRTGHFLFDSQPDWTPPLLHVEIMLKSR